MIEPVSFIALVVIAVGIVLDIRQSRRTSPLLTSEQLKEFFISQADALQYDTRFETLIEGMLEQMHHTPMEVTNPVLYDLLVYVIKFRYQGIDRLCDEVEIRATQHRHLKEEVHYLSIRPE